MSQEPEESTTTLPRLTLEANETHKDALDAYTNKLQVELSAMDKLIAAVEQLPEDESLEDPGDKWCLHVDNAFKPTSIIDLTTTLEQDSPFYEESVKRARYLEATTPNPFSTSEKRYLEKAVVKENRRLAACRAQQRGQEAFKAVAEESDFFLKNVDGINWASVARDVSAANYPLGIRTAQECKVRWLGAQHPNLVSRSWEESEDELLREIVESKRDSKIDWEEISQLLATNRTPLDCIRKYQTSSRTTFHWTGPMDRKLMDAVREHGNGNWVLVAQVVSPEVSANQCQIRYTRSLDPTIKRGKFTAEEDNLLQQAVEAHGTDWVTVSQVVPGRTNTQCRDRYSLLRTPGTPKATWTEEEEEMLKRAVKKIGNNWVKVREEMGCLRERSHYANRYKMLVKKGMQEPAQRPAPDRSIPIPGGSRNEEPTTVEREAFMASATVPISRAGPINEEITVAARERDTEPENVIRRSNIGTPEPTEKVQKAKSSTGSRAKGSRKNEVLDTQPEIVDHTPQKSLDASIPTKRPRPRPMTRAAIATDTTPCDTLPVLEPDLGSQDVPQTNTASKTADETAFDSASASLFAELSDLTDLEDLEDGLPPKKKNRGNPKIYKAISPVRPKRSKEKASRTSMPLRSRTMRSTKSEATQDG